MIFHTHIRKSKTKKKPKAIREQYQEWLKTLEPKKKITLDEKRPVTTQKIYRRETPKYNSVDTGHKGALTTTGIMKDYHKLSESDREIVNHLSTCVAPLHKGNYVYVSEGMNPASLGRKNEVL